MAPLRLTRSQWGTVAQLKTSGGTWSTYLSDLRRAGLVDETAEGWTLTAAGFEFLGGRPDPMTPLELQQHYLRILRAGAAKMLTALIDAYPDALSREQLGDAAGLVHAREHPAAENVAVGIGVRRHGDDAHGECAARARMRIGHGAAVSCRRVGPAMMN